MSMNQQDRQVIESLFTRLSDAERQAPPRDVEAEALIDERIRQQPAAPYFMAQTLVMQEYALQQAQQRVEELESRVAQRPTGGGIFSSLFGGGQNNNSSASSVTARRAPMSGATPMPPLQPGRGGGGFLAGAAQTAMGVAGGVLLGNAIAGMFGGNEAKAAEPEPADTETTASNEAPDEDVESFDSGFGDDDSF
jgi:hypothetical protein